jgi:Cytochrome c
VTRPRVTRLSSTLLAITLLLSVGTALGHDESNVAIGEAIYRLGMLPSGEPLQAERAGGVRIDGVHAACVNCHRRSGLGMREGQRTIPPVAGSYLFHPRAGTVDDLDLPFVEGMQADRDPYTDATLARAIRTGVGVEGRKLSYLMPQYALSDAEMSAVIAYLKSLSPGVVPGVTRSVIHFATIVTPDADAAKRKGVLDVLRTFFEDKNHYTRAESPRLQSSRRMMFKVNRRWELHIWELTGAPETWEQQLQAKLAAEPVFAVISGVGGKTWAPVHRFCEQASLPCIFPNVDLPVVAESDFDSLYFSKGVLLEANLIANALRDEPQAPQAPLRRVVQVYRGDDVGAAAAAEVGRALGGAGPERINRVLPDSGPDLSRALRDVGEGDAVVFWLRSADIAALPAQPPARARVFLSGRMGGLEHAPLPASWRSVARIAYPFDLPEQRRVRVDYPLGWFRIRQVPVVAEQEQTDTYLACSVLSETMNHMVDTFVRDYLVERLEGMLEHRIITGYYPRLALAPAERFASKGGYLVHFAGAAGTRVVAETGWIAP